MRRFRDIQAWQKAHRLALEVYRITGSYPKTEMFGLTSQMRRASVSITSNIAEGCGRKSGKELARFMLISIGSASELENLLLLSRDLQLLDGALFAQLEKDVVEVKSMLSAYVTTLKSD